VSNPGNGLGYGNWLVKSMQSSDFKIRNELVQYHFDEEGQGDVEANDPINSYYIV